MAAAFGLQAEEDPAAEFLAQQQHEIAGIENDEENLDLEARDQDEATAESQPSHLITDSFQDEFGRATMNGELFQESNDVSDGYAAIAHADVQRQEPESLRKWREEQKTRLEELDSASKAAEIEWKQKAKKELEDWHTHQREQMEKNKDNNRIADKAFYKQPNSDVMGFVYVSRHVLKNPVRISEMTSSLLSA